MVILSRENTHQSILGIKCHKAGNFLTKLPTFSINIKLSVILLCSNAMNKVFNTMQTVMARSIKGSFMKAATFFLILNQSGQQSQIRYFKANSFRHGGHLCWDSSSSKRKRKSHYNWIVIAEQDGEVTTSNTRKNREKRGNLTQCPELPCIFYHSCSPSIS